MVLDKCLLLSVFRYPDYVVNVFLYPVTAVSKGISAVSVVLSLNIKLYFVRFFTVLHFRFVCSTWQKYYF